MLVPVTTPVVETVASAEFVMLHTPPARPLDNAIVPPGHTLVGPDIVPDPDDGPTVMILVAVASPQLLNMVYDIVSVPGVTPVKTPSAVIVAWPLLLLHAPPATLSDKVMSDDTHTTEGPVIVPALSAGFTVIGLVVVMVPQATVTVYMIVSAPAATPVTIPVGETVALVFELLHTPPVVPSVSAIVVPTHTTEDAPVILLIAGAGLTVTGSIAATVPHELVNV